MSNIPCFTEYSPSRWQYGVNVTLENQPGNIRVDRLRTILSYEADFNFNNKIIGKKMMKEAAKNGIIVQENNTEVERACVL